MQGLRIRDDLCPERSGATHKASIVVSGFYRKSQIFISLNLSFMYKPEKEIEFEVEEYSRSLPAHELQRTTFNDYSFVLAKKPFTPEEEEFETIPPIVFKFNIQNSVISVWDLSLPNVLFERNVTFDLDPEKKFGLEIDTTKPFESHCSYEATSSSWRSLAVNFCFPASFDSPPQPVLSVLDQLLTYPLVDVLEEDLFCHDHQHEQEDAEHSKGGTPQPSPNRSPVQRIDGKSCPRVSKMEHISMLMNEDRGEKHPRTKVFLEHTNEIECLYLDLLERDFITFYDQINFNEQDFKSVTLRSNLLFKRDDLVIALGCPEDGMMIKQYRHDFNIHYYYFESPFCFALGQQANFTDILFSNFEGFQNFPLDRSLKYSALPAFWFKSDRVKPLDTKTPTQTLQIPGPSTSRQ